MIPSSIEVCAGNWNQIPGGLSLLDWLELTKGRNSVSVFVSDVWSRRKRRDKKTEEMHSYKGRISMSKQSWQRLCNTGWRLCQLLSVSYYSLVFFLVLPFHLWSSKSPSSLFLSFIPACTLMSAFSYVIYSFLFFSFVCICLFLKQTERKTELNDTHSMSLITHYSFGECRGGGGCFPVEIANFT